MSKLPEFIHGKIPVIGVVGGIGSGKSYVARLLSEHLPVVVVDADAAGHQVLEQEPVKQAICERFGSAVFSEAGDVDRRQLGHIVFGTNEESVQARHDLEAIVHPRIGEILKRQIATAISRPEVIAVVLDAAVLLETGWKELCDAVVFVDVPEDIRRQRVIEKRNWTADEFESREANQLPVTEKKELANFVIDNSGTGEDAVAVFRSILQTITMTP